MKVRRPRVPVANSKLKNYMATVPTARTRLNIGMNLNLIFPRIVHRSRPRVES